MNVKKVLLCPFHCKPRPSGFSLESPGLENIPQIPVKSNRSWSKSGCAQGGLGYSMSLKVKWVYISTEKLETNRSKSFVVSISLQTKAIRS